MPATIGTILKTFGSTSWDRSGTDSPRVIVQCYVRRNETVQLTSCSVCRERIGAERARVVKLAIVITLY